MSYLETYTLHLINRNEGKIKSYESCFDVRAWSHDICTRDRYLKEWIKCDMPAAVVPLSAIVGILRKMNYRSRGKVTPRCHLDCKSRVILDSINTSCHAMKECLRKDHKYETYFIEEELETSHWPCDRCLEALKSIKMFWRVIIDRVFNINISKNVLFQDDSCCTSTSIRDVAKMWQKDLVQQAVLVKAITEKQSNCSMKPCSNKNLISPIHKICSEGDRPAPLSRKNSRCIVPPKEYCKKCKKQICKCFKKSSSCDTHISHKKVCKCTSVRVKTFETGCNTRTECEQMKAYRTSLEYLKRNYDVQSQEVQRLKNENCTLKLELENLYNSRKWKSSIYKAGTGPDKNRITMVPKPFDSCIEEKPCPSKSSAKTTESEMIITMKNCKNDNFKHVSLLQVLHKTNEPMIHERGLKSPCHKKEDPIELLNKVQTTLGAMFRRELSLSAGKRQCAGPSDIEATFQSVTPCKSRSCTTLSSRSKQTSGTGCTSFTPIP